MVSVMEFSNEALKNFQAIWKRDFGESITADEARHHGARLVELFTLLSRPLPSEQGENSREQHT